jgi:thiol-disulfide isomerase/thioredoxin
VGGDRVGLRQLVQDGRPLALAFVDPGCGPCRSLLPDLARPDSRAAVVISRGDPVASRVLASDHDLPAALLDPDGSVADAYEANGTPAAVAIGPDGLIRSELAAGPDAVRLLLDHLDDAPSGDPVPQLELEDLDGAKVSLRAAAAGEPYLMLFWSPACGFCNAMLDDVRTLERRDDLPPLLLIATGDPEGNRAQGLQSRTLLDPGFAGTGQALGVAGTPSAVRLDAEGRVVSGLAVGVDQVLALAGARGVDR